MKGIVLVVSWNGIVQGGKLESLRVWKAILTIPALKAGLIAYLEVGTGRGRLECRGHIAIIVFIISISPLCGVC